MNARRISLILVGLLVLWEVPDAWASCEVHSTPPTYTDGTVLGASVCDTSGAQTVNISGATTGTPLDVNLATLLSGEDQTNNLIQTSGGKVRQTVVASAVLTDTTSTAVQVPIGKKTLYGQVVCSSGACTQTQKIYGDIDNDAANGVLLCTLTLSATTRDQASCLVDAPWSYVYVITTATTGTSAAGAVTAMY